jgi:hypothetical protein
MTLFVALCASGTSALLTMRVSLLPPADGVCSQCQVLQDLYCGQRMRLDLPSRFALLILMHLIAFETKPRAVQFNRVTAEIGGKNGGKR